MFDVQCFGNNSNLLLVNNEEIYLFNKINNEYSVYQFKHSCEITSAIFLEHKHLIAFTDLNKFFYLVDYESNNNITVKKSFQKKAAKLLASRDESTILLGDKTGDVYSLDLNDLSNSEFKLIMGHLSMLTDMKFSQDEKFLLTSDRDEKIRISHYPNSYNIQGYLLAHKEFVIQFDIVDKSTVVSASGDSDLILWDLETFKAIQKIETKSIVSNMENEGIDRFDYDFESQNLVVHTFRSKFLLHFKYNSHDKKFEFKKKIDFDHQIDHFICLGSNKYLLTNLSDEKAIFFITALDQIEKNDSVLTELCNKLNSQIKIVKPLEVRNELEKNYQSYFKAIINNMDDYFQRKQERINATVGKRKYTTSSSEQDTAKSKLMVQ